MTRLLLTLSILAGPALATIAMAQAAPPDAWVRMAAACVAVVDSGDPADFAPLNGLVRSEPNRHGGTTAEALARTDGEVPQSEDDPLVYLTYFHNPSGPGGRPVIICDIEMNAPAGDGAEAVAAALADWAAQAGFDTGDPREGYQRCTDGSATLLSAYGLADSPLIHVFREVDAEACEGKQQ